MAVLHIQHPIYNLYFIGVGWMYLFYWIDIFCYNPTFKVLRNIELIPNIYEHIEQVKNNGIPKITIHMHCYHFETRYRSVSSTDSKGHTTYRNESYQEKVVTWKGSLNVRIFSWKDKSENIEGLEKFIYTRIHFKKTYLFADERSQKRYVKLRDAFIKANEKRDSHYSVGDTYDIS